MKYRNRDNRRMNWKTILSKIQSHGLSQMQVAERLGKSQAWVSAVSQGKYSDLRWADGQAMLALLEGLCSDGDWPAGAVNPVVEEESGS